LARVPYKDVDDLPQSHQGYLKRPINLFRALANSPGALKVHHDFGEWVRWDCNLDAKLREHIILLVGLVHRSPYEFSHHVQIARDSFGVSSEEIWDLIAYNEGKPTKHLTPAALSALAVTNEIAKDLNASDATWAEAAHHFNPEELIDIAAIASFYVYVVSFLASVRIDVEPEWQVFLAEFGRNW
jgi:alkylhydroperoxidase family enzyme